ncbi:MAG: SDR family oxidoreductase, partial [Actinobacteria bacterium]|nr:SDR family oxidoreductase [Actinomycetota bacterium]
MRLKNKFAVIIGGAVGIGSAITKIFAREGCNLFITYHGDKEKSCVKSLEKDMKEFNIKFYYENLDVLKKNDVKEFFIKSKNYNEKLDIAVNNAGVSNMKNFVDLAEEDWDFNMDIK